LKGNFRVGAPNPPEIGYWHQKWAETLPYQKVGKWSSFDHRGYFDPKDRPWILKAPTAHMMAVLILAIGNGYFYKEMAAFPLLA